MQTFVPIGRSGPDPIVLAVQATVAQLVTARDAHQASITANAAAVTALQGTVANDKTGADATAAAVTALQNKISADEATVAGISSAVGVLQAAKTADEALLALINTDVTSLKASRVTSDAAIMANATAIVSLQSSRTTDEAAIAANQTAIVALQAANATEDAAISANAAALTTLQGTVSGNAAAITALTGRVGTLEAGSPSVLGLSRVVAWGVDSGAEVARYRVLRPALGRTYAFSLVAPSVANVLSITAAGVLSTVAAGFDALASEGTVSATVRATDDQGATVDLAITLVRRVPAATLPGSTRRVYVSSVEITVSNASYNLAGVVPAGATEVLAECVGAGASGYGGRSDTPIPGHGGNPGQVTRRTLRIADMPATLAVTVGAGGVSQGPNSGYCYSANGGDTSLGTLLKALGGKGTDYAALSDIPAGFGQTPGDVPSGPAGRANGSGHNNTSPAPAGDLCAAVASMGPGGGGGAIVASSQYNWGGKGADSGVHLPASTRTGGAGGNAGAGAAGNGSNAVDVWGYGSGGGGSHFAAGVGGNGGLPGGGGGGGGTGAGASSGAGGRGAIRLHFYKYEAP